MKDIIEKVKQLRTDCFTQDIYLGDWFARNLSQKWGELREDGIKAACQALCEEIANMPGTEDIYKTAQSLAQVA